MREKIAFSLLYLLLSSDLMHSRRAKPYLKLPEITVKPNNDSRD